jgi:hypothetical protein
MIFNNDDFLNPSIHANQKSQRSVSDFWDITIHKGRLSDMAAFPGLISIQ